MKLRDAKKKKKMRQRRRERLLKGFLKAATLMIVLVAVGLFMSSTVFSNWLETLENNAVLVKASEKKEKDSPKTEVNKTGSNIEIISAAANRERIISEMKSLYFYEEDKLERYLNYRRAHPGKDIDEVVWQVNADIDLEFYENAKEVENVDAYPLLVNKHHRLPDHFEPKDLIKVSKGKYLTRPTAEAFYSMKAMAKRDGISLNVASAYRNLKYQIDLYNKYVKEDGIEVADTYSARPGFSEHQTGRTIDLAGRDGDMNKFEGSEEADWVEEHCAEYGFILRFPSGWADVTGYKYEPWHITYVGVDTAKKMKEEGIFTLEEYMVKFVDHQPPKDGM